MSPTTWIGTTADPARGVASAAMPKPRNVHRPARPWKLTAVAVVVVVAIVGVGWLYAGPVLRIRSVTVLGGTETERTAVIAQLSERLVGHHVWSVSAHSVDAVLMLQNSLRGEVRLHAWAIRWPSSLEVELSSRPSEGYLRGGYGLTSAGIVIAARSPRPGRLISLCPLVLRTVTMGCPWRPQVGDEIPVRLATVVAAMESEGLSSLGGQPATVFVLRGSGIVLRMGDAGECLLGGGVRAHAEVSACRHFVAPGAVVDAINPNSPAVLFNDRVG
ncbi:hypothetical protein [Ferrimicrobium sp.]|uniref:hypothetical protein n=2 Tax=Ferrimicrobium sp. TaxID=2926050 RepID=UPI00262BE2D6|nr:hypothetical protein [Ferrimicrobium sp.]